MTICDNCKTKTVVIYITEEGDLCDECKDLLNNRKRRMKIVEIIRLEEDFYFGTFGVLKIDKKVFCVTLEPPDKLNVQNVSSIPAQQYVCVSIVSPKYKETFEVTNITGRSNVLFHAGNIVEHTKGCIILGQYWGKLKDSRAVLNSGKTFKRFLSEMKSDDFHLTITENY